MASRNVNDLSPRMQELYKSFEAAMAAAEIDYILTCTYRSNDEQQRLYNQGRTTKGPVVTNAKPGQSKHNCMDRGKPAAQAFDICIMKDGKLDWDVKNPDWRKAGELGKGVGLEWAGDWKSFKEYPHFQQP